MPPVDLYLVRHAQSEWNAAGRWQGQADPPLSEAGRRQAATFAARFPAVAVEQVWSSDSVRALDTAAPLAARFGIPVEVDAELREIDVGDWSGLTRETIEQADPGALDRYYDGECGWNGGESFDEHEARSARAAHALESLDVAGAVVAVTHGGTLRAILRTLLHLDHAARWRMSGPGHASLTHLRRHPRGWRLITFNGSVHLDEA